MKLERVPRVGHSHHVGRTLEWFRKCGFIASKTEKRALIVRPGMPMYQGKRMALIGPSQDLFGVADIVAVPPASYPGRKGTWYVQVCAWTGLSSHRKKALEAKLPVSLQAIPLKDSWVDAPVLFVLERAGNRFLLVSYRFMKATPKKEGSAGRLFWQRNVEEYIGPSAAVVASQGLEFLSKPAESAGFVDWTPTDFALLEVPRAKSPKASRPRRQAVLPALF